MPTVIITDSAGLIGSESVHFFAQRGFNIVGIENDMGAVFLGESASTAWNRGILKEKYGDRYNHYDLALRDREECRKPV